MQGQKRKRKDTKKGFVTIGINKLQTLLAEIEGFEPPVGY